MNSLFNNPSLQNLALLASRALMSSLFLVAGYGKIGGYAGTQGYMAKFGVPNSLLPLVIALEIGGGIAILLGWQTRLVALLLAGFTIIAGFLFHFDWTQAGQQVHFLKNLAIAGGFLALLTSGAGSYSIDAKRG